MFSGAFIGEHDAYEEFWKGALFTGEGNTVLHDLHVLKKEVLWVPLAPAVMMVIGFLLAVQFYIRRPDLPAKLAANQEILYKFLLNKWYFDEIYDFLFVRPVMRLGRFLWKRGDGWLIDGFGPDGIAARVQDITGRVVRLQTGYVYHYAFAMLIGVAALVTWAMFTGQGAP